MRLSESIFLIFILGTLPVVVLLLKGKGWMALVAMLLPWAGFVIALVGIARLAKPNSWWARYWYRDAKLVEAQERYPAAKDEPEEVLAFLAVLVAILFGALAVLYGVGVVNA